MSSGVVRGTPVTVVIPCYDTGSDLDETVASALAQTHPAVEVVLVDDGSTDPVTLAAVERAEARGVHVVRQANAGLAAARNAGIAAATGEYVLPLDSDDLIDPTYAVKAAAVLDERPDVGIVYCRARFCGDASGPWDLGEYSLGRMLNQNLIFATAMFRRTDWEKVGGYPEHLREYEDYGFWLRILGLGRDVVRLEETLFSYRQRAGQMTRAMSEDSVVAANAAIFRENAELYLAHAEEFTRWRLRQWTQLQHWKARYGRLEDAVSRLATLRNRLRS